VIGSSILPGYGTAIGGVLGGAAGLFGGAYSNSQRDQASANQQKSMAQIMANMKALGQQNYARHIEQLGKALDFYRPAQQATNAAYGGLTQGGGGQNIWSGTGVK
jgi:gas vesicle protein